MIPRDKMFLEKTNDDNLLLDKMVLDLETAQKGNRIPVLNDKDLPLYVIHRSLIDKFIAKKAIEGASQGADSKKLSGDLKKLSLHDLIESYPELKYSFGVVSENSTLADAKTLIEALGKQCQDIFVTKTGSYGDPVIGWVTNVVIEENSQV